jgi:hypothetical protein
MDDKLIIVDELEIVAESMFLHEQNMIESDMILNDIIAIDGIKGESIN